MKKPTVVSWWKMDAPEGSFALGAWWGGFFEKGMRWQDYLDEIDPRAHPYLEAARQSAVENNIRASGEKHQWDGITPVFSDGRYFEMGYSVWGDFMAAVWSEEEDTDYSYMNFRV